MTSEAPPRTVSVDGKPLATVLGALPSLTAGAGRYRLSRFAYVRRDGDDFVLESPLTTARIVLHDARAFAVVDALGAPTALADIERVAGIKGHAATELAEMLRDAGMLTSVGDDGLVEDETGSLRTWEFHDLLFHARTRAGRHDYPSGGTYRFAGVIDPPPALAETTSDVFIPLVRPDLEELEADARTLAWAQEARMSIRTYGAEPISVEAVGEFLYRVGRVAEYWKRPAHTPTGGTFEMDFAVRPYPAGGALYELDLYVAVKSCRGVEPGLYRYDAQDHQLLRVSGKSADLDGLIVDGGHAANIDPATVQVLIVVAARFARLAWKYESIAYSLLLKNVGVLYEAMYLLATSMGLAPCALGRGDSDRFARVAGTDYYAETSVGEFLLGSLPD